MVVWVIKRCSQNAMWPLFLHTKHFLLLKCRIGSESGWLLETFSCKLFCHSAMSDTSSTRLAMLSPLSLATTAIFVSVPSSAYSQIAQFEQTKTILLRSGVGSLSSNLIQMLFSRPLINYLVRSAFSSVEIWFSLRQRFVPIPTCRF